MSSNKNIIRIVIKRNDFHNKAFMDMGNNEINKRRVFQTESFSTAGGAGGADVAAVVVVVIFPAAAFAFASVVAAVKAGSVPFLVYHGCCFRSCMRARCWGSGTNTLLIKSFAKHYFKISIRIMP